MRQVGTIDFDTLGNHINDVVTETELQNQVFTLDLSAVTDAVNFKVTRKALTDPGDQVLDHAFRGSPHFSGPDTLTERLDPNKVPVLRNAHVIRHGSRQLAQLALDADFVARDGDVHPLGNLYRIFSDARHNRLLSSQL